MSGSPIVRTSDHYINCKGADQPKHFCAVCCKPRRRVPSKSLVVSLVCRRCRFWEWCHGIPRYCRPVFVGGLIGTILGALMQWLR